MRYPRRFELPTELSKEQDAVLAVPLEGRYLVIGGPGTGKSVVALLRARRLAREKKNYLFLVYNHTLRMANTHLFGKGQLALDTWDSWFRRQFKVHHGEAVPLHAPNRGGYRAVNWEAVGHEVNQLEGPDRPVDGLPMLVIDEGQDMPKAFYESLMAWGFENFFVVADQNQQLHVDHCSSRRDIENTLDLEPSDTIKLKCNYRNAYPVAQLAREFYTSDPASPPPDLPEAEHSALTPQLVTYGTDVRPFDRIIRRILTVWNNNPTKLIGIITPDNRVRDKFYNALLRSRSELVLDSPNPEIHTYSAGSGDELDFGSGGIMILNAHSCKGLEFETVFLVDVDQHQPQDDKILKDRFYVMASRARERVILLRTGQAAPIIEGLLPDDRSILERY